MVMTVDKLFVDTNILVYSLIQEMPLHELSRSVIERLIANEVSLWISPQIVRESLAVLTRPNQFSEDISPQTATQAIQELLPIFQLAEVTASATENLLEIVANYDVKGKQIHDANIVATMQSYGLITLLTENPDDFKRYQDRITPFTLNTLPLP